MPKDKTEIVLIAEVGSAEVGSPVVGALVGGQVSIRAFAMQTCVASGLGALKYPVCVNGSKKHPDDSIVVVLLSHE